MLAIIRGIYISKQQLYNNYTWIIKISFLAVIFIGPLSHTIGPLRGCGPLALGNFYYILYYMERAQFLTRRYMFSLHHQILENIINISYLTYIFVLIVGMSALLWGFKSLFIEIVRSHLVAEIHNIPSSVGYMKY